jgi:hypothetical protein
LSGKEIKPEPIEFICLTVGVRDIAERFNPEEEPNFQVNRDEEMFVGRRTEPVSCRDCPGLITLPELPADESMARLAASGESTETIIALVDDLVPERSRTSIVTRATDPSAAGRGTSVMDSDIVWNFWKILPQLWFRVG